MSLRLASLPLVLLVSGCLVGELEGIPCVDDGECPTGYFCDLVEEVCLEVNDNQSAPNVQIVGARAGSGVSLDVTIPVEETTRLTFVLENQGATPAKGLRLEFAPLLCMESTVAAPLPAELAGGASIDVPVDVYAEIGCGDPITVDWFAFFSGRGSRGTYSLFLDEG